MLYILGAAWPLRYGTTFVTQHAKTVAAWAASCIIMSIYTLLPANKAENITLV